MLPQEKSVSSQQMKPNHCYEQNTICMESQRTTEDKESYKNDDSIWNVDNQIKKILNILSKKGQIMKEELQMKSGRPAFLYVYGRTKITFHVSPVLLLKSSTYNASKELTRNMDILQMGNTTLINAPLQSFHNIKDLRTEEDEIMTSLNVIEPFMSIDPEVPKNTTAASLHKYICNLTEYAETQNDTHQSLPFSSMDKYIKKS